MTAEPIAAILLAAGQGTRMKSALPKVMHQLAGRPMILHLLDMLSGLAIDRKLVVVGPESDLVRDAVAPVPTVVQTDRLGTAHAVAQTEELLRDFAGTVLVLYGDAPLLKADTVKNLLAARVAAPAPAIVVLGFNAAQPKGYGRLLVGPEGLMAIVEEKDATEQQRALTLCNSGVMAIDASRLFALLQQVGNDNAKGEYYLTDIVGLAVSQGLRVDYVEAPSDELQGINTRAELAAAEAVVQHRLRQRAMAGGATLTDPASVFLCSDTKLGQDVVIGPHVVLGPGVSLGDSVEIRPFCHLEGVTVASGVQIGPFARLRPGSLVESGAHIGNFVEIKNASIAAGAKVNHLTYVGDAAVGAGANLGAGTITCNYDGFGKFHTEIGAGAFIGSNSALVAPVTIGAGAIIGAGSVITRDVTADALAVGRGNQMELPGWAERFRERRRAEKLGAESAPAKQG